MGGSEYRMVIVKKGINENEEDKEEERAYFSTVRISLETELNTQDKLY